MSGVQARPDRHRWGFYAAVMAACLGLSMAGNATHTWAVWHADVAAGVDRGGTSPWVPTIAVMIAPAMVLVMTEMVVISTRRNAGRMRRIIAGLAALVGVIALAVSYSGLVYVSTTIIGMPAVLGYAAPLIVDVPIIAATIGLWDVQNRIRADRVDDGPRPVVDPVVDHRVDDDRRPVDHGVVDGHDPGLEHAVDDAVEHAVDHGLDDVRDPVDDAVDHGVDHDRGPLEHPQVNLVDHAHEQLDHEVDHALDDGHDPVDDPGVDHGLDNAHDPLDHLVDDRVDDDRGPVDDPLDHGVVDDHDPVVDHEPDHAVDDGVDHAPITAATVHAALGPDVDADAVIAAVTMAGEGQSRRQIADALDRSHSTVGRWIRAVEREVAEPELVPAAG